jgi:methionyl-tRNA formyltransferase
MAETFDSAIEDCACTAGIPFIRWRQFQEQALEYIDAHDVVDILCIGWRYLISPTVIQRLEGQVFIAHDSLLPRYRGFAPVVTAILAGDCETGVTFLRAGSGIDDGDIFFQKAVPIHDDDAVNDVYARLIPVYIEGALRFVHGGFREACRQDESRATYSIWRDDLDYCIDWTCSAKQIERLIRALGAPYPGAQTTLGGNVVVLKRARVVDDVTFAIRQPGKIWSVSEEGLPTVVCGEGMLQIVQASSGQASVIPLTRLRQRFV